MSRAAPMMLCVGALFAWASAAVSPLDVFENTASQRLRERARLSETPGRAVVPKTAETPAAPAAAQAVAPDAAHEDAEALPAPLGERLRVLEAPTYQVIGYDYASVGAVAAVCEEAARAVACVFDAPEVLPRPLLVQLIPPDDANRDGVPWVLEEGDRGAWILSIRWNAATRLRDVCEGAACALLAQSAAAAHGLPAARALPAWLGRALGLQAYVRLQSVRLDGLQEDDKNALTLADLLADNASPERLATDGFWLLRTVQQAFPERALQMRCLARLATSPNRMETLSECMPDIGATDAQRELWWAVVRCARAEETPPRVWTIAQSREFLAQNALIPARIEGVDRLLTAPELWALRAAPAARAAALDRLRLIRLRMGRVNPVYFNAAVSYAGAMEALCDGREDAMRAAYARFTQDIADALALERAVAAALDTPAVPAASPSAPESAPVGAPESAVPAAPPSAPAP